MDNIALQLIVYGVLFISSILVIGKIEYNTKHD